jgi:hypothetical protein
MEYNLIKTIKSNYGYIAEEHIVMTPFPADLNIVPGIGQIVNNLSIVIPLHNKHDFTNISKKSEFEVNESDQLGAGNETENLNEPQTNSSNENTETEAIPFNELKRKSMDETVYQSFMHPKMFKTNSLNLDNVKTPTTVSANQTTTKSNQTKNYQPKMKHKFNIS